MGLLSSLRPKPKIEGELARCGLTEWWLVAFTADERRTVETTLAPLFKDKPYSLTAGQASGALSASLVLQGYSSWFSTGGSRGIAQRILEEAERRATTAVERHFLYQRVIEFHSPRQSDPAELQAGLAASERQVEHAVESALAWRQEMKAAPLPRHAGYEQLIGIREQEGEYDAAIELCQRAASQGWAGDWDKHLKRVAGRKVLIKTLSAVRGGLAIAPDDSILAAVALSDRSWILQKKMVAAREESVNQLVPEIRRLLDQAIELVRQMEGFARAEAEQIERNDGGADDLWANVDLFRTLGFDLYFLDRRFETAESHPSIAILADDADVLASQ